MQLELTTYLDLQATVKNERYLEFLKASQAAALASIKKRLRAGRKIRLAIQATRIQIWPSDELVRLFLADPRFETEVVLIWENIEEMTEENALNSLADYFAERGLPYRKADGSVSPSDYDIIIYTFPYWWAFDHFHAQDVPLTTLLCYIPYCFWQGKLYDKGFNLNFHNALWKYFQFTREYGKMASEHRDIGSHGMIYTGYPKLDPLLEPSYGNKAKWKIAPGQDPAKVKKIIWAPHHTLAGEQATATFLDNYEFMLSFASSHPEYSFFFKPHQCLSLAAIDYGLFANLADYYRYCEAWDNLPNARFSIGGYMDYFQSSDALITDCDSFLTEYLYVNKPCLYLMNGVADFNDWGSGCLEHFYKVRGRDYPGIVHFINHLIDTDPKRPAREQFYKEHLDYYTETGRTAAENVYHAIATEFDDIRPC